MYFAKLEHGYYGYLKLLVGRQEGHPAWKN